MNPMIIFIALTFITIIFFTRSNSEKYSKLEYVPIRVDDRKE